MVKLRRGVLLGAAVVACCACRPSVHEIEVERERVARLREELSAAMAERDALRQQLADLGLRLEAVSEVLERANATAASSDAQAGELARELHLRTERLRAIDEARERLRRRGLRSIPIDDDVFLEAPPETP